jgi:hypoxanthine phosphoribosyltransferase
MSAIDLTDVDNVVKRAVCLHDKKTVEAAIDRIASEMNRTLKDEMPIFLCVMNGAVVFMGQLITRLTFPLQINYVHASRYQGEMEGRELHWVAEPTLPLRDRNIVIVEDILDGGLTLAAVRDYCLAKKAAKIYTATLVDKQRPREKGGVETCDFVGIKTENKFLIGYGLDYQDFLRNLPGIYAVEA